MTRNQLNRLVRSVAFRRRLNEDLAKLEAELISFMEVENLNQVAAGGYKVKFDGGDIQLEKMERRGIDEDQLEFEFKELERRDEIERQIAGS